MTVTFTSFKVIRGLLIKNLIELDHLFQQEQYRIGTKFVFLDKPSVVSESCLVVHIFMWCICFYVSWLMILLQTSFYTGTFMEISLKLRNTRVVSSRVSHMFLEEVASLANFEVNVGCQCFHSLSKIELGSSVGCERVFFVLFLYFFSPSTALLCFVYRQ